MLINDLNFTDNIANADDIVAGEGIIVGSLVVVDGDFSKSRAKTLAFARLLPNGMSLSIGIGVGMGLGIDWPDA